MKHLSKSSSWLSIPMADGVCTLSAKEAQRILREEFGVEYTLPGVYDLLHRLGFSSLAPRPRHRKNDPEQMQQWLDNTHLLSRKSPPRTPGKGVEVWLQDEARIGQQGTLTRRWGLRGSRPTAIKQTEYEWVYLFDLSHAVDTAHEFILIRIILDF